MMENQRDCSAVTTMQGLIDQKGADALFKKEYKDAIQTRWRQVKDEHSATATELADAVTDRDRAMEMLTRLEEVFHNVQHAAAILEDVVTDHEELQDEIERDRPETKETA